MKKNLFIVELIKSPPFRILIILALLIILGVMISNRKHKSVQLKEDVLYIQPKPAEK
jgi:hypothetical protein